MKFGFRQSNNENQVINIKNELFDTTMDCDIIPKKRINSSGTAFINDNDIKLRGESISLPPCSSAKTVPNELDSSKLDIQMAAEALQSLRASSSSSSPATGSGISLSTSTTTSSPQASHILSSSSSQTTTLPPLNSSSSSYPTGPVHLPPIIPSTDLFFNSRSGKSSSSYYHRHSPYHSRSSSISSNSITLPTLGTSSAFTLPSTSIEPHHSPTASPPLLSSTLTSPTISPQGHKLPSIDAAILGDSPSSSSSSINQGNNFDTQINNKRKFTPGFLNPLVSSAAKIYEQGKSYSPRFKYSAEKLESVISSRMNTQNSHSTNKENPRSHSSNILPLSQTDTLDSPFSHDSQVTEQPPPQKKKRPRSTWQGVLVTASSIATSLSYENKQRLRYCLHLLKLANTHIASKVNQLQDLIQEERATAMAQSIAANHVPSMNTSGTYRNNGSTSFSKNQNLFFGQKVNTIKRDIIWTIRKVVSALSTYAGNSLPEPARSHVRNYILRLPARWVSSLSPSNPGSTPSTRCSTPATAFMTANATDHTGTSLNSPMGCSLTSPIHSNSNENKSIDSNITAKNNDSTISSPASFKTEATLLLSPVTSGPSSLNNKSFIATEQQQKIHSDAEIGTRVLSLATEALEMLGSIIAIVDETLDKAEIWCDRFGRVGINSGQRLAQSGRLGVRPQDQPPEVLMSSESMTLDNEHQNQSLPINKGTSTGSEGTNHTDGLKKRPNHIISDYHENQMNTHDLDMNDS